jgi:uncharacterized protein YdbL (DUF1318 family)
MIKRFLPKILPGGLAVLVALFALSAFAADLDQAKRDGLIGERADGYLGLVVADAGDDVRGLVADINGKRKQEYQRIARANNLTLEQVQALAGEKAINKTAPGQFVLRNGGWERK